MIIPERNITIDIIYEGEIYSVKTYPNEYRSLMMLIYDRLATEEFGECLGMGKCGTCVVEILESPHQLSSFDRNEATTIAKAGIKGKNVRLSCQILIDENIDGLKVEVLA